MFYLVGKYEIIETYVLSIFLANIGGAAIKDSQLKVAPAIYIDR